MSEAAGGTLLSCLLTWELLEEHGNLAYFRDAFGCPQALASWNMSLLMEELLHVHLPRELPAT